MSLEDTLSSWAQSPSQSEQQRCANAEQSVGRAIAQSTALQARNVSVFTHGSYHNRVNVRQDSDVDIGVRCRDTFYFDLPAGYSREYFGLTTPATYSFSQFKNDLEQALVNYFGRAAVTRGDKAFDLKNNSYRVEADVAPFFVYRNYSQTLAFEEGVKLITDSGREIINYPEQHYVHGVQKNTVTSRRFKGMVRILKRVAALEIDANSTPRFLIECMTYNAPNGHFMYPTWTQASRAVLAFLFNSTLNEACSQWIEVSELKWLFEPTQNWDLRKAHQFADRAWERLGFN